MSFSYSSRIAKGLSQTLGPLLNILQLDLSSLDRSSFKHLLLVNLLFDHQSFDHPKLRPLGVRLGFFFEKILNFVLYVIHNVGHALLAFEIGGHRYRTRSTQNSSTTDQTFKPRSQITNDVFRWHVFYIHSCSLENLPRSVTTHWSNPRHLSQPRPSS